MRIKNKGTLFFSVFIIIVITYITGCIYFSNKLYLGTKLNDIDISLKSSNKAKSVVVDGIKNYKLQIIGRDCVIEEIKSEDIDLMYNLDYIIDEIKKKQKSYLWIFQIFLNNTYEIEDIVEFNKEKLDEKFELFVFFQEDKIIEPQNAEFRYKEGRYFIESEILGNKVKKDVLYSYIISYILKGKKTLDIEEVGGYLDPKFKIDTNKALNIKNQLNKVVSSKIIYKLEEKVFTLDGDIINEWLSITSNYEIIIDEKKVKEFVQKLDREYNTIGKERTFFSTVGEKVIVKGGDYGTAIDINKEKYQIIDLIKQGALEYREPVYRQKVLEDNENDIGKTYVEINLTKQYLWFYEEGKLLVEGNIVTGNESRGNKTPEGVYLLKFKQKDAVLKGENYEAKVKYWMPFNGGIGIHDASWRGAFGGSIYKNNGSHGCVNAPTYVAKAIFENIEPGTPVICYK